jgi:hypothetical protein
VADGQKEWQVVGGKKKTGGRKEPGERREEQEWKKIRGMLGKVAGTGRLSVPQPGTAPSIEGGDEIEADIVRFSEAADMDRYVETY